MKSSKEKVTLYRERQKALGRKRVEFYLTDREAKYIKYNLDCLRKGQK